MVTALMVLQFIVSIALIVVILLQRSKGEGLGSIGGSAQMFFDQARGIDKFLENSTKVLAIAFVSIAVLISILS